MRRIDDGTVDITDAIVTLGYLFLGTGDPACVDAADADDSGTIEISDPIVVLGALFLGAGPCGPDLVRRAPNSSLAPRSEGL